MWKRASIEKCRSYLGTYLGRYCSTVQMSSICDHDGKLENESPFVLPGFWFFEVLLTFITLLDSIVKRMGSCYDIIPSTGSYHNFIIVIGQCPYLFFIFPSFPRRVTFAVLVLNKRRLLIRKSEGRINGGGMSPC